MKTVKAKWALKNKDDINIIDVRSSGEFAQGHIEGSKNIPAAGAIMNAETFFNKEEQYYIICQTGGRSSNVTSQLEAKGYKVTNVEGGNSAIGN